MCSTAKDAEVNIQTAKITQANNYINKYHDHSSVPCTLGGGACTAFPGVHVYSIFLNDLGDGLRELVCLG